MTRRSRYSPEMKERAVRMVFDQQAQHESQWSAISSIASKIDCTRETLRTWVRRAERAHGPVSARSPFWRKLGTRKSRLETKSENEALSALLARLWCHLTLQNPANRAENLIRLCSATIGQTGWRMVKSGAIRSRLETPKHRSEPTSRPIRGVLRVLRVISPFSPCACWGNGANTQRSRGVHIILSSFSTVI